MMIAKSNASTKLKNHNDFCVQDMVCFGGHSEDN